MTLKKGLLAALAGLIIGLVLSATLNALARADEGPIQIDVLRGGEPRWAGYTPKLVHIPEFKRCAIVGWDGSYHGGPWALQVPCPWEEKK